MSDRPAQIDSALEQLSMMSQIIAASDLVSKRPILGSIDETSALLASLKNGRSGCDQMSEQNFLTQNDKLIMELVRALERAKMWLYLDDGSPYADEETREMVNTALAKHRDRNP